MSALFARAGGTHHMECSEKKNIEFLPLFLHQSSIMSCLIHLTVCLSLIYGVKR